MIFWLETRKVLFEECSRFNEVISPETLLFCNYFIAEFMFKKKRKHVYISIISKRQFAYLTVRSKIFIDFYVLPHESLKSLIDFYVGHKLDTDAMSQFRF